MVTASTGRFQYEIDGYEFSQARVEFHILFDDLWDRALRAGIHEDELTCHTNNLTKALSRAKDFEDAVGEAIGVLCDERQAAIYLLMCDLIDAAYTTGASTVLAGLDKTARERIARRTEKARAARTSPEREAMIAAAIESYGPKVVNIQKRLRQLGITLGDDAIRRRRKK